MQKKDCQKLLKCPFCGGEAKLKEYVDPYDSCIWSTEVFCTKCRAIMYGDEYEAIHAWNTRNYLEKQDSSKELMEFVKFCRNASATEIRQIHDRARDLIANYKECCNKSCKEEDATFEPLVPKWVPHFSGGESLDVSISQYKKLRFRIYDTDGSSNFKYHCDCTVINFIGDKDSCIFEEVGEFYTLEEAKAKANECIKELGENLVYFANNIKTEE